MDEGGGRGRVDELATAGWEKGRVERARAGIRGGMVSNDVESELCDADVLIVFLSHLMYLM